jgi:hemolysin D
MNAITPIPPVPAKPRRRKVRRSDQEFLAPALEILETPPSPIRLALLVAICLLVAVALTWTYFGRVDIIATAEGKIEPSGKVKVLQPLQAGQVVQILAHNGDHVVAGQVLLQLDKRDAQAQVDDLRGELDATRGEVVRRQAAIGLVANLKPGGLIQTPFQVDWAEDIPAPIQAREQIVLDKDLGDLNSQLSSISAQVVQKRGDAQSLSSTVAAQQSLVDTLQDLASMRETLFKEDTGSKADWLDAVQTLKQQQVTLATDISQQQDSAAGVAVLQADAGKAVTGFLADYGQKLEDAQKQADDLQSRLQQAETTLGEMTLLSPTDGTVQASTVTTIGQVVTAGEELLRVVPDGADLEIEAYLPNDETGFVKVGQRADVKVAAFPYTQYGTVEGTVTRIGKDALSAADATQAADDGARPISNPAAGATDPTSGLVFPVTVRLAAQTIEVDGKAEPLTPGMSVTAEVNTGSRRILEYLFSPIVDVGLTAMRER